MRLIKLLVYLYMAGMAYYTYVFLRRITDEPSYSTEVWLFVMAISLVVCFMVAMLYINEHDKDYKDIKTSGVLETAKMTRTHGILVGLAFYTLMFAVASLAMWMGASVFNALGLWAFLGFAIGLKLSSMYLNKKRERGERQYR